jgi:hypothetical protein
VGIEHPILGLLTFTVIAVAIVSAVVMLSLIGMNVQDFILKTPTTEGFAQCFSQSLDLETPRYKYNLSIIVANSGRVDLKLEKIFLATDKGIVEVRVTGSYTSTTVTIEDATVSVEIILKDFSRETELWAGQRGLVRINIASDKSLYTTGGQYSATAYLTTIGFEAFTVREARFKVGELEECPPITPPPPLVPLDIIRVSRSAIYWDTFDTNPIDSRLILVQELGKLCNPAYVPGPVYGRNGLVYLEIEVQNRECALLAQGVTLPNTGSIYTAFTALIYDDRGKGRDVGQPGLFGAILTWDFSLTNYYTGGFNELEDKLFVRVKTPATTAVSSTNYMVEFNKWYNGTLALFYVYSNIPDRIVAYASPNTYTFRILAPHERLIPYFTGLSINKLTTPKKMGVYFDNILVTVGTPPWIVRVESLQPGWTVTLKDSSGRIIDSKIAGLAGVVELNVWGVWIIKDGVIEVYNSSNTLLLSRSFPEIVGGDVYRVTGLHG